MPKKKKKNNLFSIIAAGLVITLFVAVPLAAPLLTKDQKAEQQEETKRILEEYTKQQEEQAASQPEKEVDETFKQDGDITALQIIDLVTGSGQETKASDTVTIKYKGALASDGTVFNSNQEGYTSPISGFVQGWIEGLPGMRVGGKRKLVIPSEKGYGAIGSGSSIPANADLVFEVELISIAQ